MSPAIPVLGFLGAHQPQLSFVHQRRCLQRLAGLFLGELLRRQFAQFVVNKQQELLGSVRVAVLDGGQDLGHVTHWHPRPACQSGAASSCSRPGCATESAPSAGV
jgi:hypothetical protein